MEMLTLNNEKEMAIKDFKKLLLNGTLEKDFETIEELEDILSELFAEKLDYHIDAQEAYDDLDSDLDKYLSKYFCYRLGTSDWTVNAHYEGNNDFDKYSKQWSEYYSLSEDIIDYDDLCSSIEHRVRKDMSNVGCDCKTALSLICDDIFVDGHPFYIDLGEENPRILYLD